MYIKCIVVYSAIEGFTLQMSIEKYACFVWLRKSKKKSKCTIMVKRWNGLPGVFDMIVRSDITFSSGHCIGSSIDVNKLTCGCLVCITAIQDKLNKIYNGLVVKKFGQLNIDLF